ncbi:MAG: hypothetical protein DRP32_01580 [Thermotogae bacterium]|uniref:DUF1659 domain-containing protein n=1 Tax=Kosmotoga sp. TaxID=1955248 RepID=UPI000F298D86|nr:DUF1659 domain-containing protein [Kosmotoga sp.]MBO8166394.1 DUF1659 domain-containing protein [Kosmotoga sp.]MCD6159288.1 DUF1659 domain-containing protein [Kosmotoga sp.]RKX50786.1 MAG: hypothetical protein DRP32_01580 [Thermotogota bacterium]
MGLGSTVVNLSNTKRLQIVWDTGVVEDGEPVYYRQSISVDSSITEQEAYDAAYNLASLSTYTISEIRLISTDSLGPID